MDVSKVDNIDFNTVYKVLSSSNITDGEKSLFIQQHRSQIDHVVDLHISSSDYKLIMKNRPLIKFRPLKNSFTKRGDKKILAQALSIPEPDIDDYVDKVVTEMKIGETQIPSDPETLDKVKTYVYRHGKKEQVVKYLDYELSNAKDMLKVLYSTLEYNTGGVADYFVRPIHRLDNKTLSQLYDVVNKNLKAGTDSGAIPEGKSQDAAQWALVQIFRIQNNQRLRNAFRVYQKLS